MTISEQIIQVMNALCEKFGIAMDWTGENVLPYVSVLCSKLISYEIWTSIVWFVFATIGLAIATVFVVKKRKAIWEEICTDDFAGVFILCFIAGFFIMCLICIGVQVMDIVKCLTFPELHIIEYVQGLIQSGS